MRDALVVAAKASDGKLAAAILKADRSIKRSVFGGWRVLNKQRRKGRGRTRR